MLPVEGHGPSGEETEVDRLQRSIRRGLDYLAAHQLPDGEFQTQFFWPGEIGPDGSPVQHPVFDSSPFTTSLVVESLQFLKDDPAAREMIAAGNLFLQGEMDTGGLWRYWSRKNPRRPMIAPDLDDTACISWALQSQGIAIPDNRWVFHDSRDSRGLFYTWVYTANTLHKRWLAFRTRGRAFSCTDELWQFTRPDDICAVVNANVILYLGETRQTRMAIDYLLSVFREGTEASAIVFYAHPMCLYYMASRALFHGVSSLAPARDAMVERMTGMLQEDGSFGDELRSALAVCSLLNLGTGATGLTKTVDSLLQSQREDGSWSRVPMYGGPPDPTTFGSAELTTAFCLEALARYRVTEGIAAAPTKIARVDR